mmetsp:Transcript_62447/g.201402  ORF Transcript_62447/g.201402 Transcript_62447/m.201402 type:complete len:211 (+) Transcript_62447:97-729(+)
MSGGASLATRHGLPDGEEVTCDWYQVITLFEATAPGGTRRILHASFMIGRSIDRLSPLALPLVCATTTCGPSGGSPFFQDCQTSSSTLSLRTLFSTASPKKAAKALVCPGCRKSATANRASCGTSTARHCALESCRCQLPLILLRLSPPGPHPGTHAMTASKSWEVPSYETAFQEPPRASSLLTRRSKATSAPAFWSMALTMPFWPAVPW